MSDPISEYYIDKNRLERVAVALYAGILSQPDRTCADCQDIVQQAIDLINVIDDYDVSYDHFTADQLSQHDKHVAKATQEKLLTCGWTPPVTDSK